MTGARMFDVCFLVTCANEIMFWFAIARHNSISPFTVERVIMIHIHVFSFLFFVASLYTLDAQPVVWLLLSFVRFWIETMFLSKIMLNHQIYCF